VPSLLGAGSGKRYGQPFGNLEESLD